MEGLNKAELGVRLAEIRKIKNEKAATVKKLEAELKGLQRAHEVQSTAHDEQTRQLDETMYKLTMVNEEYEALQTAQRRIRQQGEIPETEDVRKLCVAIARQYLSEVKTEDELRERMDRTGGLGDASGLFSEDVDLDVDGKMVHIDGFDDGVDSEDEDEAAGQAAVALLEAEMKERKKMETALEHAEHLADGTDPTGMAMMIDEKMDDTDLQGALGLFAGAGDDPNDLDAQGDYEEKTHAALGGGGSGGSSGGGGGGGAGGGGTGGSMDGGGSGGTGGGDDDDPGSKFQKEQHDKAIQLHREMKEAEVWLERRQRLSVRKERNLESKLDGQKRIKVKYSTDGNVFFEVMLLVNQGDTFQNVLEEACAHWGLPSDSAFLQDWEDEAIWPASSVIEESVDIQLVTPCVRLVFRLGYNVQQLVASAGGDLDPDLQQAKAQILDMTDDVEKIEKELIADGQVNKEGAGAKRYIERKSKMTRDLMLFMVFFILLNVTLGMRRAVSDLFYLTSTLREATVERPFFVPILRETPIITSNASLWEDGGGLAPAPAPPTAMAGGGAGAPNAPGLSRGGLTLLGYENKTEMARTTFRDIRNDAQLWYWLEHVLMDAVFPPQSAGNTSSLVLKDNVVAGHSVRLRQLRSRVNTSCEVSKVGDANKWVDFCYSGWSKSTEDQMAYIPAWIFGWTGADDAQGVNAPGHSEVDSILNEAFTYHRDKDLAELSAGGTTDITGRFDNYGQGGYKYDLKVDLRRPDARAAFKRDLELLKRGSWTGRGTRAMTVDLALYNQNLNMFVTATYVFELTLGGGYGTSFHMATVRLESDLFTIDNMAISVCEILLHLFVLYFLWCQLLDMYHAIKFRGGCGAYLGNFWKLVDLLMIGLYFSSVGFRVMQYLTFAPYADRLRVENVFDFTLLRCVRAFVLALAGSDGPIGRKMPYAPRTVLWSLIW